MRMDNISSTIYGDGMRRWSLLACLDGLCLGGLLELRPPSLDPGLWLSTRPVEDLATPIIWFLAFALASWMAFVLTLAAAGALIRSDGLARASLSIVPRLLRSALLPMVASAMAAMLTTPPAAALGLPMEVPPPPYVPTPAGPGPTPTTVPLDTSPTLREPRSDRPRIPLPEIVPSSGVYVVVKGDNLWRIACRRVAELLGIEEPTSREIVPYWLDLIDLNRDRLRSGDPDLIYPGEELLLP